MKRLFPAIALALLLSLVPAIPSFAGGWAVITLDELPAQVVAGEPREIGFMVRQHGISPMTGLKATVYAKGDGFGESLSFASEETGQPGHYAATLSLPEAGEWEWSIQAFSVNQPMPALTVVTAPAVVEKPMESAPASVPWSQWVAGLAGGTAVLAGLAVSIQRKARWAIGLILAGLLLGAGTIVSAAGQPPVEVESEPSPITSDVSQVELGRRLFIAKGCMVCHSHAETNGIREFGIEMGPSLTEYTAHPDYLRLWLKDPLEVKSTAQMPQLELKETEIEALIAFINAD